MAHQFSANDVEDALGHLTVVVESMRTGATACQGFEILDDCRGGNEDNRGFMLAVEMGRFLADLDHNGPDVVKPSRPCYCLALLTDHYSGADGCEYDAEGNAR